MSADIQHSIASGYYDTTQQHFMAMSQMMGFENYNAPTYPNGAGMAKEEQFQFNGIKSDNMIFHPFFSSKLSSFAPQLPTSPTRGPSSVHSTTQKKKPQPVPEDQKDEGYRERRRRNNEAARKSRDHRKKLEDLNGRQLQEALRENKYLAGRILWLETEITRLRIDYTNALSQLQMLTSNNQNPPPPPSF